MLSFISESFINLIYVNTERFVKNGIKILSVDRTKRMNFYLGHKNEQISILKITSEK